MGDRKLTTKYIESSSGRYIEAAWWGGAYIELTFGRAGTPTEVINVWDDGKGESSIPFTHEALRAAVVGWVAEQDREAKAWARDHDEPLSDWYGAYIENARYA